MHEDIDRGDPEHYATDVQCTGIRHEAQLGPFQTRRAEWGRGGVARWGGRLLV